MTMGQYNIQLASKISGVGVHTIRAWEKRYQALKPKRSSNGRREYSEKDIEKLTLLNELCLLGQTISKIANLSNQNLKDELKKLGKTGQDEKSNLIETDKSVNLDSALMGLIMALESYKLDIINHEIQKLKLILGPKDLALKIISPLLYKVGIAVNSGKMTISQEHALSAILKFHLGHYIFTNMPTNKKPATKRYILCTPEGDHHEFGIIQAALLLCHLKIPFVYLGPNLPLQSLLDTSESLDCRNFIIGSTVLPENFSEKFIDNYIKGLSRSTIGDSEIIIGGGDHLKDQAFKKFTSIHLLKNVEELLSYFKKS